VLEESQEPRGVITSRKETGTFSFNAQAVIVASGGIGGNLDLVRRNWPERLGKVPSFMLAGVPAHVDGRMLQIAEDAGSSLINRDRMWHYVEGLRNFDPIWPNHGIRVLPGPSSMWFDATGKRFPSPLYPGSDTLGQLTHILHTGYDYSWFILNQTIIRKEFALSGSEQNPDFTGKNVRLTLQRAFGRKATGPVEAFKSKGKDFLVRENLEELVAAMNELVGTSLLDAGHIRAEIEARDRETAHAFSKDNQMMAIRNARRYLGDKLVRTAKPHRLLDPKSGPLIAVKLNILTRKTLGGLETDLDGRVFGTDRQAIPGLYAVGEAAGFGGGGMHGYRALEGAFLGGCIFSGRCAGRAVAKAV
jgi:predicted oxidoreductase